jgi:hypothetical protein
VAKVPDERRPNFHCVGSGASTVVFEQGGEGRRRVTVATIDEGAARVVLRCEGFVDGDLVMDGDATVRVPRRRRIPTALEPNH